MKSVKATRYIFLYTIYFLIALSVYGGLYFLIESKNTHISDTLAQIESQTKLSKQMTDLQHLVVQTSEGRAKLANYFVDSDKIIEFLETIEGLGKNAGVDVSVSSLNEVESADASKKELSMGITFEGEWENTHHFLVLLESLPVKMNVDRLSLRESKKTVGQGEEAVEQIVWRGGADLRALLLEK